MIAIPLGYIDIPVIKQFSNFVKSNPPRLYKPSSKSMLFKKSDNGTDINNIYVTYNKIVVLAVDISGALIYY